MGRSGLLALSELLVLRMALTPDNSLATRPRVRVACARTGEFLYEPSHPRLDQIRLYVFKKWTWINGQVDLPEAHTLFYLHFMVAQQPIDDFMCLGELTLGRSLDIMCVVKSP